VPLSYLDGLDSLLSIVQMPAGIPVATVAIGNAKNAGVLAARILGIGDPALRGRLLAYERSLADLAREKGQVVRDATARLAE
jgi:5-(carboxyamino)imidazole ribonucleotide mutase